MPKLLPNTLIVPIDSFNLEKAKECLEIAKEYNEHLRHNFERSVATRSFWETSALDDKLTAEAERITSAIEGLNSECIPDTSSTDKLYDDNKRLKIENQDLLKKLDSVAGIVQSIPRVKYSVNRAGGTRLGYTVNIGDACDLSSSELAQVVEALNLLVGHLT